MKTDISITKTNWGTKTIKGTFKKQKPKEKLNWEKDFGIRGMK